MEAIGNALLLISPLNICWHPQGNMVRIGVISADSLWFINTKLNILAV